MSVFNKGGRYYISVYVNSVRIRRPSPDNSRRGALAYEAFVRSELAQGRDPFKKPEAAPRRETFGEFVTGWLATEVENNNKPSERYGKRLILNKHLLPFFGRLVLRDITGETIERYKAAKLKTRLSPKTVNNHLAILSKGLHTAERWKRLERAPEVQLLRAAPPDIKVLSREECERLLSVTIEPHWRLLILLAIHTGLRRGELLALEWSDVDLDNQVLRVRQNYVMGQIGTPKNHKVRYVPMSEGLNAALRPLRRPDGLVVRNPEGKPFSTNGAHKAMHRASERAGVPLGGWHRLRHTFATQLVQGRLPSEQLMQWMGHSTIAMTQRYTHLAPSNFRAALSVLPTAPRSPSRHPVGTGA